MPLTKYGVLAGSIIGKLDSPDASRKNPKGSPHYEILVLAKVENTPDTLYRVAVNVKSDQNPSNLYFYLSDHFDHEILTDISKLPMGFTLLQNPAPNAPALDFLRGNLFPLKDMRILPASGSPSGDDMNDIFDQYILQAISAKGALLYAFDSQWGPEPDKRDPYFDFLPGNGIHDIHMNQGNLGKHEVDNGIYQDGGLFIYFPDEVSNNKGHWVAMFSRFQSQIVPTDDHGDAIEN
jgi:uncharacterized protein YukJ